MFVFLKELAKIRINNFIKSQSENYDFVNHTFGKQRWEGIINYMMAEDWSHKLPSTIEYLEQCDKTRGTNFRSVFPDLKDLI